MPPPVLPHAVARRLGPGLSPLERVGVARQRKASVDGLKGSIAGFTSNVGGTSPKDVVDLLLITQYFDMLRDIGSRPECSTVYIPEEDE